MMTLGAAAVGLKLLSGAVGHDAYEASHTSAAEFISPGAEGEWVGDRNEAAVYGLISTVAGIGAYRSSVLRRRQDQVLLGIPLMPAGTSRP